jgi:hypothetical protein
MPNHLLARWFLARLVFDPEDGGDIFLRNVGSYIWTIRRYIPEDEKVHNYRCESLKSYLLYLVCESAFNSTSHLSDYT